VTSAFKGKLPGGACLSIIGTEGFLVILNVAGTDRKKAVLARDRSGGLHIDREVDFGFGAH